MKVYQARKNTTTNHSSPSLPSNHATTTIRMFCIIAACITSIHAHTTTATVTTAGKFGLWNKPKYTPSSSSSSLPTTTNTSTQTTKTTTTTTKTRRCYSPIEIGVQSALYNMFGGGGSSSSSPLSSASSAAAFTRGSMPVVPNYFSKEQQQYTKQKLPNKAAPLNKSFKRKRNASNLNIATSSSTTTTTTTAPLTTKSSTTPTTTNTNTKDDASTTTLSFFECMICGAISRSVSQTLTHPADTLKTLLQLPSSSSPNTKNTLSYYCQPKHLPRLMRGAGAKIILSIPLGAANFAVLEYTKMQLLNLLYSSSSSSSSEQEQEQNNWQKAGIDFLSSSLSTLSCSILSVPQTVIMDNIMAGRYENLISAVGGIGRGVGENGGMTMMNIKGFYRGWGPSMIKSIPSYGLTWVFFEQLKSLHTHLFHRNLENTDNLLIGCIASAASVCIMIPMDTIKTRLVLLSSSSSSSSLLQLQTLQKSVGGSSLVIQQQQQQQCYNGIIDCASKIIKEEGITALYRGLTPRLMGVVPMIGIQFGVYEFMKRYYIHRKLVEKKEEKKEEGEEEVGVEIGSW